MCSMALKKLQVLLDAPGQYKARLNDAVALQRIQDSAPAPPANQLSPTDLERLFQVSLSSTVHVICNTSATHVWCRFYAATWPM